ncbi:MAG: alpha/beta hydrolase-fold protein [Fibrobacterota bacterium]
MNRPSSRFLLFATLAFSATPFAEPTDFAKHTLGNTRVRDLPRDANGREFRVLVALPYSYESNPSKRYPVLYLCDGYWDFTLVNGLYGNILYDKTVPEFIIVGLSYTGDNPKYDSLRRYDYTPVADPSTDPKARNSGHGKEFLAALQHQIIPFVQKEYRVDTTWRGIAGSSLGGLFALYTAFEAPGLFQGTIAPSPAIVWANGWINKREAEFARSGKALPTRLFLSTASEEWPDFTKAIRVFNDTLDAHKIAGLVKKWRIVDGERHAGTKAESYNRGLRYILSPLAPEPSEK